MKTFTCKLFLMVMGWCLFSACQQDGLETMKEAALKQLPPPAKYLALGDAYTLGEGIPTSERWPMQLSSLLDGAKLTVGEPLVLAEKDWTSGDLLKYLRSVNIPNDYGLVSLMIGANNHQQGRSKDEFRTEFRSLVNISVQLAQKNSKNVVVLTIPNWGVTPYASGKDQAKITAEIQQFNQIIQEEATRVGVQVIDVNDLSLQVVKTPALLAADNLHYSGSMYAQWAQRVLPAATAILSE